MPPIPIIPSVRGHIDLLQRCEDGSTRIRGWIFRHDTRIDKIDITLQDRHWVCGVALFDRPDVATVFEPVIGHNPNIMRCGFDVTADSPAGIDTARGSLVGIKLYATGGCYVDLWRAYFFGDPNELSDIPDPPLDLQERVGGSRDFNAFGKQIAGLVTGCVGKYKSLMAPGVILDWGCGCGRVIKEMMKFAPADKLYGCDIDAEAIAWDTENIHGPTFVRVEPYPPTPFLDATFDIVYGISVMTHLNEQTQISWLKELNRISRSGAILVLSVIGEQLRISNMPASLSQEFDAKGFASFVPGYSGMLAEFSGENYYQEAYHSLDYIASQWGRYFDILEYVETKHQDLVVLRKR